MLSKLKTQEEISRISEKVRSQNKTIVTTNGSFDILHPAHIRLLEKAKQQGDILIVLLNSDASIKRFKGPSRPIQNEKDRTDTLSALEIVNYIVIFDEDTPLKIMEKIKPHIHVKGGSFILERLKAEELLLAKWGGKLKNFELEKGYSTTSIIEKILKAYNNKNPS